jgi:beta-galactosidase
MIREPFNDNWTVGPKKSAFEALMPGAGQPLAVRLPHDSMRDLQRSSTAENGAHTGYYPGSHVSYEKSFDVPSDWRERSVTLEFEGIYRDAVIYINNDFVAQRPNGYSTFSVQIDPYLAFGASNTIKVEARQHEDSRWYSGTGIYRDTWLMVSDPVHVAPNGVKITTPEVDSELAVVIAEVTVVNQSRHTRTVRVRTDATERDQPASDVVASALAPLTLLPGESATAHLRLYVSSPKLWSVDHPNLYTLRTTVTENDSQLDEDVATFGIRTIQLDPTRGLRINGEPVKLRGGCVHHDNGPLGTAAIARAEERRVEILKEAGYNAIRSAHNPLSRSFIEACDRIGMLVIDELTDVWTEGKTSYDYSLSFPEWWERDVEAMVAKDFNHPSVIMYSIGNEIFEVGRPLGSRWGRELAKKVRELDSTRLVTNAINGLVAAGDLLQASAGDSDEPTDINSMIAALGELMNNFGASDPVSDRTEEAHSQLDASGINYSEARYAVDAEKNPNRVEYGSETFPGALDRLWALVEQYPHVIGDFAWTAWDYMGEAGVGRAVYADDPIQNTGITAPYPFLTADCGTIDITGVRRPISYWRETVWGLRVEPYIAVHRPQSYGRSLSVGPWAWDDVANTWSWDVDDASPVVIDVYSNADEIKLLLDGEAIGTAEVGTEKAFIARFETKYRPGELTAVAFRDGTEVARTSLTSASGSVALSASADRSEIRADASDLAFIEISMRDTTGVLAPDAIAEVSVSVDGPAELVAFATAHPNPEQGFNGSSLSTYNGRALAILRPTGPGRITLTARAQGQTDTVVEVVAAPTTEPSA